MVGVWLSRMLFEVAHECNSVRGVLGLPDADPLQRLQQSGRFLSATLAEEGFQLLEESLCLAPCFRKLGDNHLACNGTLYSTHSPRMPLQASVALVRVAVTSSGTTGAGAATPRLIASTWAAAARPAVRALPAVLGTIPPVLEGLSLLKPFRARREGSLSEATARALRLANATLALPRSSKASSISEAATSDTVTSGEGTTGCLMVPTSEDGSGKLDGGMATDGNLLPRAVLSVLRVSEAAPTATRLARAFVPEA